MHFSWYVVIVSIVVLKTRNKLDGQIVNEMACRKLVILRKPFLILDYLIFYISISEVVLSTIYYHYRAVNGSSFVDKGTAEN